MYKWVQSFLDDQTQRVVVDEESSATAPVTSGRPYDPPDPSIYQRYLEQGHRPARLFADDCLL